MKVKDLKKILEQAPDEADVIISDEDRVRYLVKDVELVSVKFKDDSITKGNDDMVVVKFSNFERR